MWADDIKGNAGEGEADARRGEWAVVGEGQEEGRTGGPGRRVTPLAGDILT